MRLLASLRGRDRGYANLVPQRSELEAEPTFEALLASSDMNLQIGPLALKQEDGGDQGVDSPRSELSAGTADGLPKFGQVVQTYRSEPPPPEDLWDTDDVQYLDKVKCHAWVRLTHVDPKNGSYEGRMKCHWSLRTLNTKDRTEPRIRVPGIRLPRLVCSVEESRIWRHFDADSEKTIAWQGTSVISFTGYEIFEVHDFPFDRQIITLDLFEFVWRTDKDSDIYHEAMKIVTFTMETISMLPEWDTFPAILEPCDILQPGSGPTFGTKFIVKLRLQRKERYYVTHIFLVSLLILVASLLPLSFEPGDAHIGDRLSIHSGGLLTLVAFKYGVSHDLPSVPYSTFISTFLTAQIFTLVFVCAEGIFAYKVVGLFIEKMSMNTFEDFLLATLLVTWLGYFLHLAFNKKRVSWEKVLASQDDNTSVGPGGEQPNLEPPQG
jgi:hypothetical protein